jgi:hypothetical protein
MFADASYDQIMLLSLHPPPRDAYDWHQLHPVDCTVSRHTPCYAHSSATPIVPEHGVEYRPGRRRSMGGCRRNPWVAVRPTPATVPGLE